MDREKRMRMMYIVLAGLAAFCILLVIFWKVNGPKVVAAVNSAVLSRAGQTLNGKLMAGNVEYSLFGSTSIYKIVLQDARGETVATCDELIVDYSIADLLSGDLGLEKVKTITLDGLRIVLRQDKTGRWNLEDLAKTQVDKPLSFRGQIALRRAFAEVTMSDGKREFERLEGALDFKAHPKLGVDLKGVFQGSTLSAQGSWSLDNTFAMTLKGAALDLTQVQSYLPVMGKFRLLTGQFRDFTVTAARNGEGKLDVRGEGAFSGASADFDGTKLSEGQGKMKVTADGMEVTDMTVAAFGQKITAAGKINLTGTQPRLDFTVSSPAFDPAAVVSGSPIRGAASFRAAVSGPADGITASGDFQIPSGTLGSTAFTGAAGTFSYTADVLRLGQTRLNAMGGSLTTEGDVNIKTTRYTQQVTGQNVDIGPITDKAVQGRANFTATVSGQGNQPDVRGQFQMASGSIQNNAFTNAAGGFRYAGDVLTLDQVRLSAMDGALIVSGTYNVSNSQYQQKVSGENIDAGPLSDKAVQGRVDFTANLNGQGDVANGAISGSFSMRSGVMAGTSFTNMTGQFVKKGKVLEVANLAVNALGQRLNASGQVSFDGGKTNLNMNVSSPGMDITAFQPSAPLRGAVAFQAAVTGTPDKFAARGNFQIPAGQLGIFSLTNGTGAFRYADEVVTIENARANALGGTVTTSGTLSKAGAYSQRVSGANIDAAQVTDGDVKGRAEFQMTIAGSGDWEKASADGTFQMKSGTMSVIPFNGMSGEFRKRGPQTEFPQLNVQFAGGLVKGTAQSEGDYIWVRLSPGNTPLAVILGPQLNQYIPQQELRIRFRGPKG